MAQITSMEAAIDEERVSVLALLEGTSPAGRREPGVPMRRSGREPSPYTTGGVPMSPVRSMLDIGEDSGPRRSPSQGSSGAVAAPTRTPYRSMLDVDSPIPLKESQSAHASPTDPNNKSHGAHLPHPRSFSDAALRPANFVPRSLAERKVDPVSDYQFLTNIPGVPYVPKHNTLAGRKILGSAMTDAGKGDASGPGIGASKSRSPHNGPGLRSSSPYSSLLYPTLKSGSGKFTLDSGAQMDMSIAYRHLSDANLARFGGPLATLPTKGHDAAANPGRVEKDGHPEDGSVGESSEEGQSFSSDNEEGQRGRKKIERAQSEYDGFENRTIEMGSANGPRPSQSLMAAAEEERKVVVAKEEKKQYKVRSLLDPEITVTAPSGDRLKPTKAVIHPNNAFDQGGPSGLNTPLDSETEAEICDIKRAQKLAVIMSPIASYPEVNRSVRTLYRGDFIKTQQEAQEDQRRVRKYLVATDLSDEAAHALEWTIGTVLRDGDTVLAIYCVEDTSVRPEAVTSEDQTSAGQAIAIATATITPQVLNIVGSLSTGPSSLGGAQSTTHSPMGRERSRAEQERHRAIEDITERVTKLLRKTKLQVRVVIEVIHCKSPKHLITEVIDFISPTLVILGSRGRSALKGVILGSFSNYLVTKSSVPVMVARKKLRKHGKYKRPSVKLANNLDGVSSRSLSAAKVDELITA